MNVNATLLGQAIAFFLFVIFCMRYVWPPLLSAIEARQQTIAEGLSAAESAQESLRLVNAEKTKMLQDAKQQAQKIIEQANKQHVHILEEAKTKAIEERQKILAQARVDAKQLCLREHDDLRLKFGSLVVLAAEKVLQGPLDSTTNQQIIERLVAEL